MKKIWTIVFLCFALSALARERVGRVQGIHGSAHTSYEGKKDRKLSKGSPIFTDEKIVVPERSKVQVKFTDNSVLNLVSDSEYKVNQYSYRNKRSTDSYSGQLLRGGFRHLTGNIAKNNPSGFHVKTPNAVIGVRGTVIEAVITRKGELFVGCESGLIYVLNTKGEILLGPSVKFQFLNVSSSSSAPEGLSSKPGAIGNRDFSSPPGGIPTTSAGFVETGGVTVKGGC